MCFRQKKSLKDYRVNQRKAKIRAGQQSNGELWGRVFVCTRVSWMNEHTQQHSCSSTNETCFLKENHKEHHSLSDRETPALAAHTSTGPQNNERLRLLVQIQQLNKTLAAKNERSRIPTQKLSRTYLPASATLLSSYSPRGKSAGPCCCRGRC